MLQTKVMDSLQQTAEFVFVPTNEDEYEQLVHLLDEITDLVRDNETHPLANIMDVISVLIETYEDRHIPEPQGDGIAVLKYLMEEHELRQEDLPELGSQGVVSEILNKKRELNLRQIRALSERFKVPAAVFI